LKDIYLTKGDLCSTFGRAEKSADFLENCSLFVKYEIVFIGVKSDWKDMWRTAEPVCRSASSVPI